MAQRHLRLCLLIAILCSACAVFMTIAKQQCMGWQRLVYGRHQDLPRRLLKDMQPALSAPNVSALLRTVIEGDIRVTAHSAELEVRQGIRTPRASGPMSAGGPKLDPQWHSVGYTYDMAASAQHSNPAYSAVISVARHRGSPQPAKAGQGALTCNIYSSTTCGDGQHPNNRQQWRRCSDGNCSACDSCQ